MKNSEKVILDACCGGRMMWFNKKNPKVLYIDKRKLLKANFIEHPNFKVDPDIIMDFRNMNFKDGTFKLVVFDPPHVSSLKKTSWMAKKYGILNEETWKKDLKRGFDECWRVLEENGVLVFKWSEAESSKKRSKTVKEVIKVIEREPLFGHPTGKSGKTMWMIFMKISN